MNGFGADSGGSDVTDSAEESTERLCDSTEFRLFELLTEALGEWGCADWR